MKEIEFAGKKKPLRRLDYESHSNDGYPLGPQNLFEIRVGEFSSLNEKHKQSRWDVGKGIFGYMVTTK